MNEIAPTARPSYLRMIAFAVCLVASVMVAALWARSYFARDGIQSLRYGPWIKASTWRGQILIEKSRNPGVTDRARKRQPVAFWSSVPKDVYFTDPSLPDAHPSLFTFSYHAPSAAWKIIRVPHWCFVAAFGGLALALKPKPRRRFSLSELMIVGSTATVAMGVAVSILRMIKTE